MKQSLKVLGKKTILVVVAAVLAGTGATVGVFAAIPHSTTGVIAGCRSTATGGLRAIDAQGGAVCGLLEVPISIASPVAGPDSVSAMLRLKPDPSDTDNYILDTGRSRNIVKVDTFVDPNPENIGYRTLCIEVAFDPEMSVSTIDQGSGIGMGNGQALQLKLKYQSPTFLEEVEYACGSDDYNVITYLSPEMSVAIPQSVFLSK